MSSTVAGRGPLGVRLSGVAIAADGLVAANLELFTRPGVGSGRDGDAGGVVCRKGEDVTGDSGRRKGELRDEPYPNGDGLYPAGIDCFCWWWCQQYCILLVFRVVFGLRR